MKRFVLGVLLSLTSSFTFAEEENPTQVLKSLITLAQENSLDAKELADAAALKAIQIRKYIEALKLEGDFSDYSTVLEETSENVMRWSVMTESETLNLKEFQFLLTSSAKETLESLSENEL